MKETSQTAWDELGLFVDDFVNDYEFRGDGDYSPNENEKLLIKDCISGMLADDDFLKALARTGLMNAVIDDDGETVMVGDRISFSYGIPPVKVVGEVAFLGGELHVMTPGHKPDRCKMEDLREYVGCFYKEP